MDYLESHPEVLFSDLFGTLVKGKLSPLSYVDIAVYLKPDINFHRIKTANTGQAYRYLSN
jgi:predicted nucleotidyltransferase